MNSTEYPLSRDRVADLEESEGDDRSRMWLSPWAIPQAVRLTYEANDTMRVTFVFPGPEEDGPARMLSFDGLNGLVVQVNTARHTRKVTGVVIVGTQRLDALREVSAQVRIEAETLTYPAARLSYKLTAGILAAMAAGSTADDPAAQTASC